MARYIDADEFREKAFFADTEADITHYIRLYGYADVVPKSEAENYRKIAEHQQSVSMDRYFEIKQLKEELAKVKQEVAREIFEEIENRAFGFGACFVEMTRTTFDELKKKYTESEDTK